MYAAYRHADEGSAGQAVRPLRLVPSGAPASPVPSRYEGTRNRPAIVAVVLLHALALFALIQFDVVHVGKARPKPLVIELLPPDRAPPLSAPEPQPMAKIQRPIETPITAPPPIIAMPAPPAPIAAVSKAPPAPAAPAAVAAPAAPAAITPPDASAANLGNVGPRYPTESRRRHEEGVVRLRVLISPAGTVEEIAVARTSGFDRLDQAALDAVRKWRFRPGMQAGQPVEAVGYLSIPFVLTR